jgi:hypothetical protein
MSGGRRQRCARRPRTRTVDRLVDREHDRAKSRRRRTVDQILRQRAFRRQIELEPARRAAGFACHLFEADRRCGRQNEDGAGRGRAARAGPLAFEMKQFVAPKRGDHDRSVAPVPQDAGAGIDPSDVVEHARAQAQPAPCGNIRGRP